MLAMKLTAPVLVLATLLGGPGKELHQFLFHRSSPVESVKEGNSSSTVLPFHKGSRVHEDCPATVPGSGNSVFASLFEPGIKPAFFSTSVNVSEEQLPPGARFQAYRSRAPPLV